MPIGSKNLLLVMRPSVGVDKFAHLLRMSGYHVVQVCTSGAQALRCAGNMKFDMVLAGNNLPDMTGLNMAVDMLRMISCSIILITSADIKVQIESSYSNLDITCLVKPVQRPVLMQTLESIGSYRSRINSIQTRKDREKRQKQRKAVLDRAKLVLMDKQHMDEETAYRAMQKTSMDTGIPLRDIAKVIIETDGREFYKYR